jgi:hypothetical protein
MFPRHAHALPKRLPDVRADDVIIAYKTCRQVATVPRNNAAPRGWPITGVTGRERDPTRQYSVIDYSQRGKTDGTRRPP